MQLPSAAKSEIMCTETRDTVYTPKIIDMLQMMNEVH